MDDSVLLRQFAENQSNEAFASLVTRYINLVYSVALRQTGNAHNAEEITQAVFIILAKKAAQLRHDKALSSWLFQTTRLTANNFIRSELRRRQREEEACMQSVLDEPDSEAWSKIAPLLDVGVGALREQDRRAVLLRFYEGRNLREVGEAMGVSEDAAEKRVGRALEKLRGFFTKRGVNSTTAIIAGAISTNSIQVAPVALAKTVTELAIAKGAAASGSTLALIKGALKIMAWTKMKTTVAAGVILLLAAGTTTALVRHSSHHSQPQVNWTPGERALFESETDKRSNDAKMLALSCILFSQGQIRWPKSFAEMKTQPAAIQGMDANWEFVSGGSGHSFADADPSSILFREKQSRRSPEGKFIRVYAFSDGSVQVVASPDEDFRAVEQKFRFQFQPAKN